MRVWSLDWEDPLKEGTATHCDILTWRMPWAEESGWLRSIGSWRVGHDKRLSMHTHFFSFPLLSSFLFAQRLPGSGLLSLMLSSVSSFCSGLPGSSSWGSTLILSPFSNSLVPHCLANEVPRWYLFNTYACLPPHSLSDSFCLSLRAQRLLPLLPRPELTLFFTSSPGLYVTSDLCSVIMCPCTLLPVGKLLSGLKPLLSVFLLTLPWWECTFFLNNAAFLHFSLGSQSPDWRKERSLQHHSCVGYWRGTVHWRSIPLSLGIHVSCTESLQLFPFNTVFWPKFSSFWNSLTAIPSS